LTSGGEQLLNPLSQYDIARTLLVDEITSRRIVIQHKSLLVNMTGFAGACLHRQFHTSVSDVYN
jgi:hypothetical protein